MSFFHQQLHERLAFVLHFIIEHGILKILLQHSHLARRLEVEYIHYLVAVDDRLQESLIVTVFKVFQFLAYKTEIVKKLRFTLLVL